MINLIKLHYSFLYTRFIKRISIGLACIVGIVLLFLSNVLRDSHDVLYQNELYTMNYVIEGLNIIKLVIVMYSMLICVYAFYINKYDVFLLIRYDKIKTIISKIIVVLHIVLLNLITYILFYSFFLLMLSSVEVHNLLIMMGSIGLFTTYYVFLFLLLLIIFDNLFVVMIPMVGYFISTLSIDYGISIKELSIYSKLLNLFFPDLIVVNNNFMFVYGVVFVICIIFIVCILTYKNYDRSDIRM